MEGLRRQARTSSQRTLVQLQRQPDFRGKAGTVTSLAPWFLWACLTMGTWLNVYRHLGLSLLEGWRLEDAQSRQVSELLLNILPAHETYLQHRDVFNLS